MSFSAAMIFGYSVILVFVGNTILTVDGIRCHQCNSHLDEDCTGLQLSIPRPRDQRRDNQYLQECEGAKDREFFCRKTVTVIESTNERRIVRSCGWDDSDATDKNNGCITADNEGFQQLICACYEDGCNAAPFSLKANHLIIYGLVICVALIAAIH